MKKITVLQEFPFEMGQEAYELEQEIIRKFSDDRYVGERLYKAETPKCFGGMYCR